MNQLASRYLTHKHASIYGCTFLEACLIGTAAEIAVIVIAVMVQVFFGYGLITGLILFILSLPVNKQVLFWLGKSKENKPYGQMTLRFFLWLEKCGLMRLPHFRAEGRLQTKRSI